MTITLEPPQTMHHEEHLGQYGLLRMDITTNPADGSSTYKLRAPHVHGQAALSPGTLLADPTEPPRSWAVDLLILFGTEPATPAHRREDPLTINGIALASLTRVFFERVDAGAPVPTFRRDKNSNAIPLPPATGRHAAAVLGAVVAHWRARPDREVLEAAGRRIAAATYLERYTKELRQLDQTLNETQAARVRTSERVETLCALLPATEHAAA
ncbi:hypothetical protein [Streptomyces sp. NBRC 110465]|uniref:hypothetical protein n=1 Tax=Streptomyces sp. NBRC 110465 TaxID=1897621 RepID=UPI0009348EE9|nr:hypothetical protein [Streptomyces sp. NBRC 110465]